MHHLCANRVLHNAHVLHACVVVSVLPEHQEQQQSQYASMLARHIQHCSVHWAAQAEQAPQLSYTCCMHGPCLNRHWGEVDRAHRDRLRSCRTLTTIGTRGACDAILLIGSVMQAQMSVCRAKRRISERPDSRTVLSEAAVGSHIALSQRQHMGQVREQPARHCLGHCAAHMSDMEGI